jgi:hypothetical protein
MIRITAYAITAQNARASIPRSIVEISSTVNFVVPTGSSIRFIIGLPKKGPKKNTWNAMAEGTIAAKML